jgi:peptidyl-prolyl cis-trans isomerase A (cyclophilin A)
MLRRDGAGEARYSIYFSREETTVVKPNSSMTASAFGVALVSMLLTMSGCKKEENKVGTEAPRPPALPTVTPVGTLGESKGPWTTRVEAQEVLYATMKTNLGDISIKLFSKEAPKTVKNFVGLATGEKPWKHPATGEVKTQVPLYNGTVFHRVIEGFMIQGGDPLGTGTGDPGYRFEDEFQSGKTFDKPGLLAMANAGPGTNGSQFFITTSTPNYLNNRHTIFGEVVKGYDIAEKISKVSRGPQDRPVEAVKIASVEMSTNAP